SAGRHHRIAQTKEAQMRLAAVPRRARPYVGVAVLIVMLGYLAAVSGTSSTTTTVVLRPIADAKVQSDHPDQNYGDRLWLNAETARGVRSSYLRFDVPAGVSDATLRLYSSAGGPGFTVHASADTWGERSITWDNAPVPGAV